MGKKRVYEIAKDEGLPSSLLLQRLQRAGMAVKTASSTIDVDWALHFLNPKRYPRPAGEPPEIEETPTRARAKAAPPPEPVEETPAEPARPRPTRPRPRRAVGTPAPEPVSSQAAPEPQPVAEPPAAPAPVEPVPAPVAEAPAAPPEPAPPVAEPRPEPVAEAPEAVTAPEPAPTAEPVAEAPAPEAPPVPAEEAAPVAEAAPEPEPQPEPDTTPPAQEEAPEGRPAPAQGGPAPARPGAPMAPKPPISVPGGRGPNGPTRPGAPMAPKPPISVPGGRGPNGPTRPGAPMAPKPPISVPSGRGPGGPGGPGQRPGGGPGGPGGPAGPGQRPGGGPGGGPGGPGQRPGGPGGPGGRPGGPGGGPGGPGRGPGGRPGRRRVVIDAQAGRPGGRGGGRGRRGGGGPAPETPAVPTAPADLPLVEVPSGSTTKDVADLLGISSAQIIKIMMGMGEMVTLTQSLSDEAIELIAEELERKVAVVHAEDEAEKEEVFEDDPADLIARAPVVTVMGHVDHGKTSLLDAIRKTEVAAGEAGGITQHIGAYQVHHNDREITFLDTPGHEAFTAMRARGAKITDVAVIVVAADDGVMPQTLEAIDHARAAEVPFMVAVNKMDKPDANPDRVRQELSQREVIPAEWGGTHEFINVSALTGDGLNDLLETVILVADADADPKANPKASASGTVIESRLDPGRGPVCTVLVQRGTLNIGDVLLAGEHFGRVRAMNDYNGHPVTGAGPSVPVEILGLSGVPDAGDKFRVVDNERTARQAAAERSQRLRAEELANRRAPVSLDDLFARIKEGGLKELNLIVKGDVQGSVGALVDALNKVEQTEVRLRIISTGVGAITESDVNLAAASQAIIIGFNVRPRPEARLLAEREGVDIRTYRVIYRAIEDVRDALVGLLEPDIVEDTIGSAEVRATFRSSRLGTIAGCMVIEGVIRRSAKARLVREGTVVHEGAIGSLRRVNDDVREVTQGFECGILLADYNDVKEGDIIEAFELREVARTAQTAAPAAPAASPAEA